MPGHPSADDLPIVRELGNDLQRAFQEREGRATAHGVLRGRWPSWSVQRQHPVASWLAVAVSTCIVALIIVVALPGGHAARRSVPAAPSPAPTSFAPSTSNPNTPARRVLRHVLAVMRSQQNGPDHRAAMALASRYWIRQLAIASSIRLVRLPDHGTLLLFLSRPGAGPSALGALGYSERVGDYADGHCCISVRALERPSGPENGSFYVAPPGKPLDYFEIVPDGVAMVRWTYARQSTSAVPVTTDRDLPPLTVTVPVHDNVAAIQLGERNAPTEVVWLAADGRVLAASRPRP